MSSMFKKKGGPAFKPKIPSARPRIAAPIAPAPATKPAENEIPNEAAPEATVQDVPETTGLPTAATKDAQAAPQPPHQPSRTPPAASDPTHDAPSSAVASNVDPRPEPAIEDNAAAPETVGVSVAGPVKPRRKDGAVMERSKSTSDDAARVETPQALRVAPTESSTPTPSASTGTSTPAPTAQQKSTAAPVQGPESSKGTGTRKRQKKTPKDGEAAAKPRSRKRKSSAQEGDEPRPKRRARSLTPEDAETQLVDLQNLRMADLTKDLHIGKKFSRHDELRDRERQARIKARVSKEDEQSAEEEQEATGTPAGEQRAPRPNTAPPAESPSSGPPAAVSGPQLRIVDGQIVVDQNSLVMDRHARAAAAQAGEDMETIEENDFTRLITSSSFMTTSKLKGPNIWTDQETAMFYHGLSMLGTDFEMISKMFPNKQRRHIKLKFNREERHCPRRIDAALIGKKTVKMDIEEYKVFTGSEFESVESIEAEQSAAREAFEAERQRVVEEQAEIMRKKREQLFADDDAVDDGGAKKKKRGGKKKGKESVAYGMNGEPITNQ